MTKREQGPVDTLEQERPPLDEPIAAFEVLDVLGGFVKLVKRSATPKGGVPLRAAQGCPPLFESNAFGFQLVLSHPVVLRRRLGRWSAALEPSAESVLRSHTAIIPILETRGLLCPGAFPELLRRGLVSVEGGTLAGSTPRLRLFTGLFVRPKKGLWLRLSAAAHRRNASFGVEEMIIPDPERFTPLVVEMVPSTHRDDIRIEGEFAALTALEAGSKFSSVSLEDAPEVGRAHLDCYDRSSFDRKKEQGTHRYRPMGRSAAGRWKLEAAAKPVHSRVVPIDLEGLPPGYSIRRFSRCVLPEGAALSIPERYGFFELLELTNFIDFRVRWDGSTIELDYDKSALAERGRMLDGRFERIYGRDLVQERRAAIWYLTKYLNVHPPGEPHFFVKPWAFTATLPGVSSVVEGIERPGAGVLSSIVWTDVFHATPAAFQMRDPGRWLEIEEGRPLLRVIPVRRELLDAGFEKREMDWGIGG